MKRMTLTMTVDPKQLKLAHCFPALEYLRFPSEVCRSETNIEPFPGKILEVNSIVPRAWVPLRTNLKT